jgi:DNA polymerase I-like protein with 3'-5' exonuclease and polymerase domains
VQHIAVDIETYDPNLLELGNGAIRKDGYVLTVGIADEKGTYSLHPNIPAERERLQLLLGDKDIVKIAHNGIYDFDWLQNGVGLRLEGKLEDTMTRASLLNEFAGSYSLDACCLREGVAGKNVGETIDATWKSMGGSGLAVQNLPLIPIDVVDKYCQQDVKATRELFFKQQPQIERNSLQEISDLECMQIPIVLEMRKNGFRINNARIAELEARYMAEVAEGMDLLWKQYGIESLSKKKGPGSIAYAMSQLGLTDQMFKTPSGDVSIAYNSIVRVLHPISKQIIDLTRKQTMLNKYLHSALVKFTIGDRIHGGFKPTKRDEGGTITGRYSSENPNMQNFSAREAKGGDLIRGVFIPEDGCLLGAFDYKQIEYRLLAHFAIGPGAESLREAISGGADYHQIVQDLLGWSGPDARKRVKVFNFGMSYGMGLNRFKENFEFEAREVASSMGMTTDQYTEHFYNEYIRRMTFLRPTTRSISATAEKYGYIRSLGGRIHHCPTDGGLYRMPNYLIQGTAADILKLGLAEGWNSGVFNVLKLHSTVHDENVFSIPQTKEGAEACKELIHCMTTKVEEDIKNLTGTALRVPIVLDDDAGPNWYEVDPKNNGHIHYLNNLYHDTGVAYDEEEWKKEHESA